MEWRLWILVLLTLETGTEGAVAKQPVSTIQGTAGLQKPMYEHAIHQPLVAQEPLVPKGKDSHDLEHEPEAKVGLIFHSSTPKLETEQSYVIIPLRQRLQPGGQPKSSLPFWRSL